MALKGPRGPVFGPLDLDLPRGGFALLIGEHGSGRTCALLCLVGRMKPSSGRLEVLGHQLPRRASKVQAVSALACSAGLDDIDDSLTVRELFAERLQMRFPPHRRGRLDADRIAELCAPTFGDNPAPAPKTVVWDLDRPRVVALQIALALVGEPELLVVDDLDQLPVPDRVELFGTLQRLAERGTTVIAATTPDVLPGGDAARATLVELHPGAVEHRDPETARRPRPEQQDRPEQQPQPEQSPSEPAPPAPDARPRHAADDTPPQHRKES